MFGLFKRKPPADPVVTDRLKLWVGALMDLLDRDTIMLAEPDCKDPRAVASDRRRRWAVVQ